MFIFRGRPPSQPERRGPVTRARSTSIPTSRSQQASPTRAKTPAARCSGADNVSSNFEPAANQVRPNAMTTSQQPSNIAITISGCVASDYGIMTNNIYIHQGKKPRKCIQDLMLNRPFWDREEIERGHRYEFKRHLQKVREHPTYQRWKNDNKIRLLWIHSCTRQTMHINFQTTDFETGDQGRIIAGVVSKDLQQSSVIRNNALSYMFCQTGKSSDLKLNGTATILRDLMWLLSSAHESLAVSLEEAYNGEGKSMYTNKHASHALSHILLRWLNVTNVDRVYLVVGAIDQCHIERKNILDLIIDCCKDLAKVKWLITSDCDDFWVDYIQRELGLNKTSFETIHLNERSETVNDSPHKTIYLKKKIKMLHSSSAKMIHLYENQRGNKLREKRRREQRKGMEVLYKGTERTNKEVERWGKEGARAAEAYLDERKGEASDIISNNPVESGGEHLFEGGAGGNALKKSGVSESEKEVNAERSKVSKIPYEHFPLEFKNGGNMNTLIEIYQPSGGVIA